MDANVQCHRTVLGNHVYLNELHSEHDRLAELESVVLMSMCTSTTVVALVSETQLVSGDSELNETEDLMIIYCPKPSTLKEMILMIVEKRV